MKKFLFLFTSLTIFLSFFVLNNTEEPHYDDFQVKDTSESENNVILSKENNKTYTASLSAIGDVLIHDRVYNPAHIGNGKYNFVSHLKQVKPYLEKADITVANQESMIGGTKIGLSSYPSFNSPHEVGDALKHSGVDIVTLANNHTLDRGEDAIQSAITYWNKIGMHYTGSYVSLEDQRKIRIIEKNGIIFSFLAYTYGTNGIKIPNDKQYLVNLIDENKIKKDISSAKGISDVVVVSLHFGKEYQRLPNEEQIQLARQLALAGADIIIGHHPHVLQPMEWIKREDGRRSIVAYSLGNFFSGQTGDYKDIGGIMQIKVDKIVKNDETIITLKEPLFIPTFVDSNYYVTPLAMINGNESLYNEIKNHMKKWMPELKFSTQF
ncbi:CapA family protein [Metabacillus sediminilitoris]|uniref:CapA family protein n=1 Tax=Metabacillus sediminilitoris TaxID=2567941 RepID=A0A4S4BVN9_9BACI|nr:CapA family protein [Metabacillus sediminilitoris]QGQ44858.1 CapA family protein [Metabacillus sediminilitoris]THF78491.1 CapA family protein [Metabacillus sediminilitoris]